MAGLSTGSAKAPLADRGNDLLRELAYWLTYDGETGDFRWIRDRANQKAGTLAGNVGPNGYRTITVNYRSHYAHRLAVFFETGTLPPRGAHVDHLNGNKADNRIANLRVTTPSGNGLNRKQPNRNNTSGVRGVTYDRSRGKWQAQVQVEGRIKHLGRFDTIEEAQRAREAFDGLA